MSSLSIQAAILNDSFFELLQEELDLLNIKNIQYTRGPVKKPDRALQVSLSLSESHTSQIPLPAFAFGRNSGGNFIYMQTATLFGCG